MTPANTAEGVKLAAERLGLSEEAAAEVGEEEAVNWSSSVPTTRWKENVEWVLGETGSKDDPQTSAYALKLACG